MRRFAFYTCLLLTPALAFLPSCVAHQEMVVPAVQAIVDSIAAKHPDIVRLTIHAVPTGASASQIIACNLRERNGRPSDPEDLTAISTGNPTVLKEGENLDYTAAIRDSSGRPIGATGVTLKGATDGRSEAEVVAQAEKIAAEIQDAVQKAASPLW